MGIQHFHFRSLRKPFFLLRCKLSHRYSYMTTAQWPATSRRSFSWSLWFDTPGGFYLLPFIASEHPEWQGLYLRITRVTVGVWRWRLQINMNEYCVQEPSRSQLKRSWDIFNHWSRKKLKKEWSNSDLESLMALHPEWKPWLSRTGYHGHYHRILISRALMERRGI